jgi:hypothetical protein
MNRGIISKMFDWLTHPTFADSNPTDWLYGIALILILSFLWTRVVKLSIEVPEILPGA